MNRGRRGQLISALAISAAVHLPVLIFLALHAPRFAKGPEPRAIDVLMVPVLTPPRLKRARSRPAPERPGSDRRIEESPAPPSAPSPVASGPAGTPAPVVMLPGLQAVLRRQLGCQERSGVRLTRDEQGDCSERLGRGAVTAPYLKAPIAPEIRTYYDQVAKAKEPQGPLPPLKARGRLGLFEAMPTGMKGHGPGFGCKFALGPHGLKAVRPPHGVKVGPCFIEPPAGSLTPDIDVQNPDDVVRHTAP